MTTEKIRIDYLKVFTGLPDIMGIPMKMVAGKWIASRMIDGSYSTRPDKLVCRQVDDGIQVLEQGGESMTLFTWMQKYGGCKTRFEAKMRLIDMGAGYVEAPDYREKDVEIRFIDQRNIDKSTEVRMQSEDNLTCYLKSIFGSIDTETLLRQYRVGAGRRVVDGSYVNMTQFWYINSDGRILHDKLMLYKTDGHRDKAVIPGRMFKKTKGYNGKCLFGEHLLSMYPDEQVYVVESEKTALLASLFYGKGLWLACGGKNNLRACGVKPGWKVLPDVDAFSAWRREFGDACVEWWKPYGVEVGEKWDIADLIVECLIKK